MSGDLPEIADVYVGGFLHDRTVRGEPLDYGYPAAPLPAVRSESRWVKSGFFGARHDR